VGRVRADVAQDVDPVVRAAERVLRHLARDVGPAVEEAGEAQAEGGWTTVVHRPFTLYCAPFATQKVAVASAALGPVTPFWASEPLQNR